jgi:hypothetical protein
MKTRFIALAVAAAMGLGSVSAFAQDHHGHAQGAWQHQRAERGGSGWGYNNRYAAPRYYAPSYGYYHDGGDVAGAIVLGALAGAALGQAANPYYYNPPPAAYYNPPPATYYNPGYGYYGN